MKKTLLLIRNELYRVTMRRSFLVMLFLVPLITFGVVILTTNSNDQRRENPINPAQSAAPGRPVLEGYVDQSGLIRELPVDMAGKLRPFADEEAAASAMRAGEIKDYYVLPADYLQSGKIVMIQANYNPLSENTQSDAFQSLVERSLLNGSPVASRFEDPFAHLETTVLSEAQPRNLGGSVSFFLPYAVAMMFYIVIFGSASLMLNNITDEKKNRMIEILMTSVTPLQMLTGKMIALGLVGLLQTVVWAGTGLALLRVSGRAMNLPPSFQLPAGILLWGVIFFLLGYAVYASLMAGIGALVPNLREASQATIVVMLPVMIPLMMTGVLSETPNGPVSVGLSLFPLTAPVAMMARLVASSSVPVWQPVLAAVLLAITALVVVRSVAGMFRAQNLLSGRAFNLKVFFQALIGQS
jgi:ABC-2 type transport system permease protein